ncbi:MAG TPA: 50S ribosomal protein L21 [Candidatus Limnocylindrales bacterium]
MYAVIETGGKQYRVELGTELEVELLDVEPGQEINLDRVLLVVDGDKSAIGQPVVADAAVSARVLRQVRGEKTISFKYRPKARRRVKKGHRQELTVLKITEVRLGEKSAAAEANEADAAAAAEREKVAKVAARQAAEDAALAEKLKARTAAPAAAKTTPKAKAATKAKAPAAKAKAADEVAPAAAKAAPAPKAKAKAAPKAAKTDEPASKAAPAGEAPKRPARTKKD